MKQKKINFQKEEQAPVILDGISLKHFNNATFIEIEGAKLDEQIDFGEKVKIETGKDENGYPIKYQIRFTPACNINPYNFAEGFYKLITNNMWIDLRDDKKDKNIIRVAQVEKFECYYEFTK